MKIIAKAAIIFRNPDPKAKKEDAIFRTAPGINPVDAPEWLRKDDTFELAVADGSVIVPEDPSKAPSDLSKISDADLRAEVSRRGFVLATEGSNVQPTASPVAIDNQQKRADAANKQNAGKAQAEAELRGAPIVQGDERTAREDAATGAAQQQAADASKTDGSDSPDPETPGAASQGVTANKMPAKQAAKSDANKPNDAPKGDGK